VHSTIVTDAVVLRQVATGEADRVVTLYTRAHGKLSALAHAAAKSRKRFGAALSPYVLGEATLREKAGRELHLLERFDARRDFAARLGDPIKMGHAAYATELLRELSPPHQTDPALLDLLVELYEVVGTTAPRAETLRAFELRLLDAVGLRPVLDRCLACGAGEAARLDAPGAVLDPERGGLVCASCGTMGDRVRPLTAASRRRLLSIQDLALADAAALPGDGAESVTACREALHALLRTHLPGPLKSLEFLLKLR
jgi:DNA repair protein RecO (recombination protein O)